MDTKETKSAGRESRGEDEEQYDSSACFLKKENSGHSATDVLGGSGICRNSELVL